VSSQEGNRFTGKKVQDNGAKTGQRCGARNRNCELNDREGLAHAGPLAATYVYNIIPFYGPHFPLHTTWADKNRN